MKTYFRTFYVVLFFLFICQNAIGSDYKYPGNSKVLLYAPGYSTSDNGDQNQIFDDSKNIFFNNAAHFTAQITEAKDSVASVDLVKFFGNYGTVIMHTHGWFWNSLVSGEGDEPDYLYYPCFRTGTKVLLDNNDKPIDPIYLRDLANRHLAVSKGSDANDDYQYVVFPSFIKKYIPQDGLADTFFFLGYCASLKTDKMWNALKGKGAKVAFGYSDYVTRTHNVNMFEQLMNKESMLPNDKTVPPKTAIAAFNAIIDKTDDGHVHAEFEKRVATSEWNNFAFMSKHYLTITAGNYILVWDIDKNSTATDVELNDGQPAIFPVLRESVSEWLANRTTISSESLFSVEKYIGQGGYYDGFPSNCFDEGWDDRDLYDYTSFNGSGGCNRTGIDETMSYLTFDYSVIFDDSNPIRSLWTSEVKAHRKTHIPYWNGLQDIQGGFPQIHIIAPPSNGHGVTFRESNGIFPYPNGSKKIQANNSDVDSAYLQISRDQSVTVLMNLDSGFLWEGLGYYQDDIDVVDQIAISDPWGVNYSNTFERYVHRYVDSKNWTAFIDISKPYPDYEYSLAGIYTDSSLAQVRVIQIQENSSFCYTEASDYDVILTVWDNTYWKSCSVETELTDTPVFDVMASVYESDNIDTVDPFSIGRNSFLEQKIKEMLGDDIAEIKLMFVQ